MPWRFASATHIGDRSEQQDRLALLHESQSGTHLLVIADGMGGHDNGADAAQVMVDTAREMFHAKRSEDPAEFLDHACHAANRRVMQLRREYLVAPGTTCVLLYLVGREAHWVHVGDSRLYHLRDSRLVARTVDHSMAQYLTSHGKVTEESPESLLLRNQLYMCVGGKEELLPEYNATELTDGDLFVLCTDGFWNNIQLGDIFEQVDLAGGVDGNGANHLVELAHNRGAGTCDNISLILARWSDPAPHENPGLLRRMFGRKEL